MNFLNFDIRKIIILAFLVAIPVFSVNMQKSSKNEPWIFRPFFFLSGITQNSFSSLTSGVRSTTDLYLNLIDIKTANRELSQELAQLKARLSSLTELTLENERLNKLIDFKQQTKMNLIAARIVARDLFSEYKTITINRGEKHGIKKGMAAITVNGAVGYTVQVEPYTSQILLLTDRYAVIDAIVQRSRARGIIQGAQGDACILNYLKRSEDVQVNDTVVTSGLDNIFPKGFPIGTVTKVEKDEYGLGQKVDVQPIIAAANLEELFVVINAQQVDFEPEPEPATNAVTDPKTAAKAVPPEAKKE
jgi:rod shape-determining protein MreC